MITQTASIAAEVSKPYRLLLSLLLVLSVAAPLSAARNATLELLPKSTRVALRGLSVIGPNDPNFDDELNSYFPQLSALQDYRALRPFLVVLRNDTAAPAVAYAFRWSLVYGHGKTRELQHTFMLTPLRTGSAVTLPPGAVDLVSPFFSLSQSKFQALPNFDQWSAHFLFPSTANLVSSKPTLTGVVYHGAAHWYWGPQGVQLWQRYVTMRLAVHDEAVDLLGIVDSASDPGQVPSVLDAHIRRGVAQHGARTMDLYIRERGSAAQEILILLKRDGSTGVMHDLRAIVNSMPPYDAYSPLGRRY